MVTSGMENMKKENKTLLFYPWWVNDWMGSIKVRRMSFEQRGLYRHLLDLQWQSGGKIQLDLSEYSDKPLDEAIALFIQPMCDGVVFPQKVLRPVLDCFEYDSNFLWNDRLLQTWNEANRRHESCRAGALKTNKKHAGRTARRNA